MTAQSFIITKGKCKTEIMNGLTDKQIKRQDFVDSHIFELIQELNPSTNDISWDIEMIGEVRDCIQKWITEKINTDSESFYPSIK